MPLSILSAHNFYQNKGGEDVVYATELDLLRANHHQVGAYERTNREIRSGGAAAAKSIWNVSSHRELRALVKLSTFDVVHFHNTFPLISPSAYYAVAGESAIVQTLHNFRLICPGALLSRNRAPCEDCLTEKSLQPAVRHACYRGSRAATAAVVTMLGTHRFAGTYQRMVDAYIVLSEFARQKFITGGLPEDRLFVKPNFVPNEPIGHGAGGYAFFAGRLSTEKGVATLQEAWQHLRGLELRIAGDGPLASSRWPLGIKALGIQPRPRVFDLMRDANVVILPSTWYEHGPLSVIEAFACGTPVIASNLGSLPELVRDGYNGLLFRPGDAKDLAAKVQYAFTHPEHMAQMRVNARREFEDKYTAERNYKILIAIYEQAMENAKQRRSKAS